MARIDSFDRVIVGDGIELMRCMPAESVDLIFTDPPWSFESLHLYDSLAREAARLLKHGRFLIAYTGNDALPSIMQACQDAGLVYYRLFCGIQPNSDQRFFSKKLFVKWRPIIVYSKGESLPLRWAADALHTKRDKRFHEWGQDKTPAMRWISAFTKEGDLVLDPFLGGGTTAIACKLTNRHWLGFEIDPARAERTRRRLAQMVLPLSVPCPAVEQLPAF